MHAQLVRVLLGVVGATLLAIPASANAHHGNADEASPNMFHLAQVERGGVNSDLAFWEGGTVNGRTQNLAAAGNYSGFRLINISDPENPVTVSTVTCRGPQGDVSFYKAKNRLLLFVSVDTPQTTPGPPPGGKDCVSADSTTLTGGFEGVRIWDVTDPTLPKFVTAVQTDCGSHTHTTIPDYDEQRALIYVSSYPLAPTGIGTAPPTGGEGGLNAECGTPNPANGRPHGKISIIEVPDTNPAAAAVINEPPLHPDTNPSQGQLKSLVGSTGCHDITVITEANQAPEADPKPRLELAAAACISEGQLWDISDPENPKTYDPAGHSHVENPAVEIWHSAAFTWDGNVVLFGDEHGGGSAPGCGGQEDPTGNIWFYRSAEPPAPVPLLGRYHIPRQQLGPPQECTLHNFNVVPINDNKAYIGVSSAYRGGTTVFDFTAAKTAPELPQNAGPVAPLIGREVGWYDAKVGGEADTWSTYWFNDYIYANDGLGNRGAGNRGFDVFKILLDPRQPESSNPTKQLRARKFHHLNPQTQEVFTVQGG